jgi:prepilin-type processing-associated H-X9-DG protein/prepilin-type N-terminal cleavage/methylation domain-containing protein
MGRNRTRSSSAARGFTLVELLVVIGIIALLVALLLASVVGVRRSAKSIACAAKLRSLGQILMIHAVDHGGYLPLAGNVAPGPNGNGLSSPEGLGDPARRKYVYYDNGGGNYCATALPAALARHLTARPIRDDSWQTVVADIQVPDALQDAFLCPSDQETAERTYTPPRWINNYGGATFLNGWSSYGVNAEIFAWTDAGVGGTVGHSRLRGKIGGVPRPAETMLMCDTRAAIEVWVLGPQLSLGDVYLGTGGTVGHRVFDLRRHRGRMNILFADGHVDARPILSTGATEAAGDLGSPGNTPGGEIMSVSMDKDFR